MVSILDIMDYIERIEDTFSDFLQKKIADKDLSEKLSLNLNLLCNVVKKNLNSDIKFDIKLINNQNQFFGMCVYPSNNAVQSLVPNLVYGDGNSFNKAWSNINDYVIEIDRMVFDRTVINFNPQELTAMLLHELSHVVFTSKTSERIYYAYKRNYTSLKMYDKSLLSKLLQVFYAVPVMIASSIHNWNIGKNGIMEEYICDQIFGLKDYQQHMVSALNKIIERFGNTVIESETTKDGKVDRSVRWCNLNIKEMSRRRDILKHELVYNSASTKSFSLRKAYLDICVRLGIGLRDKYTGNMIALDSVLDKIDEGTMQVSGMANNFNILNDARLSGAIESLTQRVLPATEAVKKNKCMKLPSEYDIDAISIEIDRIENHHDRIYVLDLIYNKIEQINNFRDYCEITDQLPKYETKIKKMLSELETLRRAVLEKRNLNGGRYQVFVKYPHAYEG